MNAPTTHAESDAISAELRRIADGFGDGGLGDFIPAKPRDLRVLWMQVGKAFQDEHPACNHECPHYRETSEARPYGEGSASEYLCDCTLGIYPSDQPEQCPALQQTIEQEAEHG